MVQEKNIQKKQDLKELHKQKSLEGMKRKHIEEAGEQLEKDDDVQYFREEVGQEPDEGNSPPPFSSIISYTSLTDRISQVYSLIRPLRVKRKNMVGVEGKTPIPMTKSPPNLRNDTRETTTQKIPNSKSENLTTTTMETEKTNADSTTMIIIENPTNLINLMMIRNLSAGKPVNWLIKCATRYTRDRVTRNQT